MSFDARAIKLLPAGAHLTSPDYPGLRLVSSARYRSWVYRYKSPIDGRMRQLSLGRWPGMSVSAAIEAWQNGRAQRDNGSDPAVDARYARREARKEVEQERRRVEQSAYTVAILCEDYYRGHLRQHRAKKGATEIRRMFDKMLGDLAEVPATQVTRSQAFDLIRSTAVHAPVQAGKLRAELGAAWDYAYDAGKLSPEVPNWWRQILRGKIRSKGKSIGGVRIGTAKRVLSTDEVGALIRWLPNFSAIVGDVLTLYLWTAARGAEICGMRGNEIVRDGAQWWWIIPKSRTKNARHEGATDLRIPLFGRGLEVVLRRRERFGDEALFPSRAGGSVAQKVVQTAVHYHQPYSPTRPDVLRPRLDVNHWAPHDLRRTSRTLLAALGCPDSVGEAILGHMLPGVLGIYNQHRYDSERVEWLGRLSARLEELAARP